MADSEPPVPRKRGRPPKPGGPKPKPVTLGPDGLPRKRGRPRKYPIVEDATKLDKGAGAAAATVPSMEPKKRGRPRKNPVEGSAQPGADSAAASGPDAVEKRKRGRPRKVPVQESDKEVGNISAEPAKRRDRPPKRPADEAPKPPNGTTADAPKKRGRPRKVLVEEETEGATEPKRRRGRPPTRLADGAPAQSSETTADPPRKRGRPRKSDVNDTTARSDKDADAGPKSGRGRPRKSDATTNNSTKSSNEANEKKTKQSATGLRMEDIVGFYTIECDAAEDYRQDEDEEMELCITRGPGGYMAEFDLGCLKGIMLLAPDKASLDRFVESKAEHTRKNAFSESDDESEEDEQPPKKKAKSSTSSAPLESRRVLFKWRGKAREEGQIHTNLYPGDNEGYLEFTDDKAQKFVGYAGFPYMGQNCKFTGTRQGEAYELSMRWSDFSREAADEANKRRWR